ncbi:MAG: NAD(P)H-dependent oxidoreductase subunit E [Myxococcales bacterium]|nr:NAD(P)H-dependent oxidoreductase subunit E [Myxococcales bacterium]
MRAETRERIEKLFDRYPEKRGALLPALYLAQAERGFVDREAAREVAELFDLAPVEVMEVLTFYNMFHTEPQGRHHVYVCTSLPCSLRGSRTLLRELGEHLGVGPGETTADGRISLDREECLGSCGTAPVLRVDGRYCENLDLDSARRIVDELE